MSLMAKACYGCATKRFLQTTNSKHAAFRRLATDKRVTTEELGDSLDQNSASPGKIVIPLRKKRDEYSVLKALASTLHNDYSAPHFKYIDDPYLIPANNLDKRAFSLAKASGQKAAKYVINQYPGNFADNPADPSIEAFLPPSGFSFADNTVEGLMERIEERRTISAFETYQKVLDAGLEVPTETAEDLLDLLCFYNSDDPQETVLADELFYRRDIGQDNTRKVIRKEWKDEGAAEMLFKNMKEPSTRASSSIIRGRAKYFQVEKAYDEYLRLQNSGAKMDVSTYNAVLSIASFLKDRPENRWELIQNILQRLASAGLTPDLNTLNAACFVLSRCNRVQESQLWFMQILNEMKNCGVEPSLTTWYYGLQVFYSGDDSQSRFLFEVIEYLKDKPLMVREPTDYEFFSIAMMKCYNNLKDLELAYKIDQLFKSNNNMLLLGDSFRESQYFTFFLRLLCLYEQLDRTMEYYNSFTPHRYTPTFSVMEDLLNATELNEGYEHLPKIWSDMVLFQFTRRTDMVEHLLNIMAKKKQSSELQQLFVKTVKGIMLQSETDASSPRQTKQLILSGKMIGDMTLILLNADDFKTAWEIMRYFVENRHQLNGFPSEQSLVSLVELSMKKADVDKTMQALSLMTDFGYPKLDGLVEQAKNSMKLTDAQRRHLDDLLS